MQFLYSIYAFFLVNWELVLQRLLVVVFIIACVIIIHKRFQNKFWRGMSLKDVVYIFILIGLVHVAIDYIQGIKLAVNELNDSDASCLKLNNEHTFLYKDPDAAVYGMQYKGWIYLYPYTNIRVKEHIDISVRDLNQVCLATVGKVKA